MTGLRQHALAASVTYCCRAGRSVAEWVRLRFDRFVGVPTAEWSGGECVLTPSPHRLDRGGEDVSGDPLRPYERRSAALRFDLPAQASHLKVDGPVVYLVVVQPRSIEQLLAREDALRRAQERNEEIELAVGSRDDVALRRFQPAQSHVQLPSTEAVRAGACKTVGHGLLRA